MNKILRYVLAVCLLLAGATSFAQTTVTFDAETIQGANSGDGKSDKISSNGVTITCSNAAFNAVNGGNQAHEYRFYKSSTTTITSTVGNITKVEFTCTAKGTAKQGPAGFTGDGYVAGSDEIGTWTGNATSFTLTASTNQVRATKIVVTLAAGSSTKKSAGLDFSASSAKAVLGEAFTAPTLTNPNKLTVSYSSSDEKVATVAADGTVSIKAAGTTTIKAETAETDEYYAGTASYTLTVLTAVDNIAAFKALGDGATALLKLTDAQVVYVNGTKDMYVRDATGAIDFFGSGLPFTKGQILNGTIVGTYDEFYGLPEVTAVSDKNLTATAGTVTPTTKKANELTSADYCDLVKVTGAYVAEKKTLDDVPVYDKFKTNVLNDKKDGTYTVTAICVPYNNKPDLAIITMEVPTGINGIVSDKAATNVPVYNLSGQRVDSSYKGVVIRNGKKFVNK